MFKLLVMLGTFLLIALSMLALRQRRLEMTADSVRIHDEILARRQTLLDQRVEISKRTNPWALAAGLKAAGMDTGGALEARPSTQTPSQRTGAASSGVETDLLAPVMGDSGHPNPNRPR
ncbi:MAG TPA: hypothetical protein VM008_10170 [Phycisphaerae bacterium]|nr:hypothetical protein [Phycisphaerae bacterium]